MKTKSRTIGGKQIRVVVSKDYYDKLKSEAKEAGLSLEHYSGLVLSGYKIQKPSEQEKL